MIEFLEKPGVVIVLLVALVVFGSKRLPDSARALGRSLRILKAEAKGLRDDDAPASSTQVTQLPAAPAVPPAAPVPPAPVAPEQQAVAPQGQPPQA